MIELKFNEANFISILDIDFVHQNLDFFMAKSWKKA